MNAHHLLDNSMDRSDCTTLYGNPAETVWRSPLSIPYGTEQEPMPFGNNKNGAATPVCQGGWRPEVRPSDSTSFYKLKCQARGSLPFPLLAHPYFLCLLKPYHPREPQCRLVLPNHPLQRSKPASAQWVFGLSLVSAIGCRTQ